MGVWNPAFNRPYFEFPGTRVASALAQQVHGDYVFGLPGLRRGTTSDDVVTAFVGRPKPRLIQPAVVPPVLMTRSEVKQKKAASKKGEQAQPNTRKPWR